MVKLGDKVRDNVSGFTGIYVSEHIYLNGCTRCTIQPPVDKNGKLPSTECFDFPNLELVVETVVKRGPVDVGGPEKYPDIRKY